MRVKAYTIVCLGMVLGMFTGCRAEEKEAEDLPVAEAFTALETSGEVGDTTSGEAEDTMSDEAAAETIDKETAESSSEKTNAAGMPLMDNTALVATVERSIGEWSSGYTCMQYEYDKEGHMLRYLDMTRDYMREYEYDSAGNLSRVSEWHFDDEWRDTDKRLVEQTEYGYDGAGRLLGRMMRQYGDDGILDRYVVYTNSGQQSCEIRYLFDADGNVAEQFRYEYDDMGNETLKAEYDAEGNLNLIKGDDGDFFYPYWRYENLYDDSGNLLKTTVYDYEGDEVTYEKCTYDNAGHMIRKEGIDGDPIIGEYTDEYTYDEKGYLVSSFSLDNTGVYGKEYEYDDNGNCIQQLRRYLERDEAGNVNEYESPSIWYENQYDERNRLIRVYYAYDDSTKYYTYETIGVADEDYPYDKIEIYGKIGETWSWYGGRIIKEDLE